MLKDQGKIIPPERRVSLEKESIGIRVGTHSHRSREGHSPKDLRWTKLHITARRGTIWQTISMMNFNLWLLKEEKFPIKSNGGLGNGV